MPARAAALLLLAILPWVAPAAGFAQQIPGSVDDTFVADVLQTGRGDVVAVQADGKLLVGGTFTRVNGNAGGGLARFNADGTVDPSFHPTLVAANGPVTVRALALQPDGKILVGGNFVGVDENARRGLARLNADGSLDPGFDPIIKVPEADVRAVAVQSDGQILVGGYFTGIAGVARAGLARLNPDGSPESAYAPALYSEHGIPAVTAMAVQTDGKLLISGDVSGIGGSGNTNLARLNVDGTPDAGFRPSISGLYYINVSTIRLQSDGKILVAGNLNYAGFYNASGVARFNADGSADGPFNYNLFDSLFAGGFFGVNALAVQSDGQIILAVRSFRDDTAARHHLVRLSASGALDPGFDFAVASTGDDADTEALAVLGDGRVVYTGSFAGVSGVARDGLARIATDGKLDAALAPRLELDGTPGVAALLVQSDGKVVVGGNFHRADGTASDGLARVDADGTLDDGFAPAMTSLSGFVEVDVLAAQGDGGVLAGGNFTSVDGTLHHGLARFGADGTLDGGFAPSFGLGEPGDGGVATISSLAVQPDGNILVGGTFDHFNGNDGRNGLVRLKPGGKLDKSFNPEPDYYGFPIPINALAVQPDGKILIGGLFTTVSNTEREGLARLNADGTLDQDFYPVLVTDDSNDPFATVQAIALQGDGKILVAGNFTYVNGEERTRFARLNPDGTLDEAFAPRLATLDGIVDRINAIAVQQDGRVLAGGNFISANGRLRHGLVRLHADGTLDDSYVPVLASQGDAEVRALALQSDGKLLAGGGFNAVNGREHLGLVRLLPGTPPEVNLSVRGTGTASEGSGTPGRVVFSATGDRSSDITVLYKLKGTARNGVDYESLSGRVVIPAGITKVKLRIMPIDNDTHGGTRHLRIKLLPDPAGGYTVGANPKADIQILDED